MLLEPYLLCAFKWQHEQHGFLPGLGAGFLYLKIVYWFTPSLYLVFNTLMLCSCTPFRQKPHQK